MSRPSRPRACWLGPSFDRATVSGGLDRVMVFQCVGNLSRGSIESFPFRKTMPLAIGNPRGSSEDHCRGQSSRSSPPPSVFTLPSPNPHPSLLTIPPPNSHGLHIISLAKTLEVQGTPLNLSPRHPQLRTVQVLSGLASSPPAQNRLVDPGRHTSIAYALTRYSRGCRVLAESWLELETADDPRQIHQDLLRRPNPGRTEQRSRWRSRIRPSAVTVGSAEAGEGEIAPPDHLSCPSVFTSPEEADKEAVQVVGAPLDPHHPRSPRKHCLPQCARSRVDEGRQREHAFIPNSSPIIRQYPRVFIPVHAKRPVRSFCLSLFHLSPSSVKRDR